MKNGCLFCLARFFRLAPFSAAYKIVIEINDAMLVYSVGRDLGYVLCQIGYKKEGIEMLKRSLAIGKAAGFPDVGEVEEMLREVGSWQRGREET